MEMSGTILERLPKPVLRELTRRSLWGYLPQRKTTPPPGGPRLALSYDLDYQADTDALGGLVELMAGHGVKSTLFSIGALVRKDPGPYRAAAAAGHEIANHTETHPDNPVLNPDREFWDLTVDEMAVEIGRAQDTLEELTGHRPTGFRTPHFKDAFRMMAALARFPEITYVSTALASKCPRPQPYFPADEPAVADLSLHYPQAGTAGPIMLPLTQSPELRWSPFCSYSSIRRPSNPAKGAGFQSVPQWEASWDKMLARGRPLEFASVYFDPLDVMRDDETRAAFSRMLGRALETGWKVEPLATIADCWRRVAGD